MGRGEVDREHRHFESGHTCLSCERPELPLADWQSRAERELVVCVCEAAGDNRTRPRKKQSTKLFVRTEEGL